MATIRDAFIYIIYKAPPPPPPPPPKQDPRVVNVPLNIGGAILDIWDDNNYYLLVCTNSGVECLNSRTFGSIWYFDSTIVRAVCSDQTIVCFGTASSGVYYDDFPENINDLGDFLAGCSTVSGLTSSGINDICTTFSGGFFVGGDGGVDILTTSSGLILEVYCQLTCSGTNDVAYSIDTGMYYWSTAITAYCADTCI